MIFKLLLEGSLNYINSQVSRWKS